MSTFKQYRKLAVALVGAAVAIVGTLYGADSTAYTTIVALATALGVWGVPNSTGG